MSGERPSNPNIARIGDVLQSREERRRWGDMLKAIEDQARLSRVMEAAEKHLMTSRVQDTALENELHYLRSQFESYGRIEESNSYTASEEPDRLEAKNDVYNEVIMSIARLERMLIIEPSGTEQAAA